MQRLPQSDRAQLTRASLVFPVLATILTWGLFLAYYQTRFGLDEPPSPSGDEVDYDAMGWELSHGRGFQIDLTNPEFRRPYDQAAETEPRFQLSDSRRGLIVYRPPGFPVIIAFTDLLLGRQFWGIRVFNSGCMAATCGILVWWLQQRQGRLAALLGLGFFVAVDVRTRLYGRTILTEPLSVLLVTALATMLLFQWRGATLRRTLVIGITFGLAYLVRSLFILWAPGMVVLTAILPAMGAASGKKLSVALRHGAVFTMAAFIIMLPWMVRNCVVLESFQPLGTQGAGQMSAAFSDIAWRTRGLWSNLETEGFYDEVLSSDMSLVEREKVIAAVSSQRAKEWILSHPLKAIALGPIKIVQELLPRTWGEAVILPLAILGCYFSRRDRLSQIGIALFFINAVAIAATWSVEGRFLFPVLAIVHYWAAIGLLTLVKLILPSLPREWLEPQQLDGPPEPSGASAPPPRSANPSRPAEGATRTRLAAARMSAASLGPLNS